MLPAAAFQAAHSRLLPELDVPQFRLMSVRGLRRFRRPAPLLRHQARSYHTLVQPVAAIVLAALLVASARPARSQPVDPIQNVPARAGQSLNGPWQFLIDPYDAGYVDFHLNPLKNGGPGRGPRAGRNRR